MFAPISPTPPHLCGGFVLLAIVMDKRAFLKYLADVKDSVSPYGRDLLDLAAHDRRFHRHGYNPDLDSCSLRKTLSGKDIEDTIPSPAYFGIISPNEKERLYHATPLVPRLGRQNLPLFSSLCDEISGGLLGEKGVAPLRIEDVKRAFEKYSPPRWQRELFDKVFAVAGNLGVTCSATLSEPEDGKSLGEEFGGRVVFYARMLDREPESVSETLLHELIHGVTSYAIDIAEADKDMRGVALPDVLRNAVRELRRCYTEAKGWIRDCDEMETLNEFVANLASPDFRNRLARRGVLRSTYEATVGILRSLKGWLTGTKPEIEAQAESEILSRAEAALIVILDNFDVQAFMRHRSVADALSKEADEKRIGNIVTRSRWPGLSLLKGD